MTAPVAVKTDVELRTASSRAEALDLLKAAEADPSV